MIDIEEKFRIYFCLRVYVWEQRFKSREIFWKSVFFSTEKNYELQRIIYFTVKVDFSIFILECQ